MKIFALLFFLSLVITPFTYADTGSQELTSANSEGFLDQYYAPENTTPSDLPKKNSSALALLKVIFITLILVLLTWGLIKLMFYKQLSFTADNHFIEILTTVPAGLGSYLLIVKLYSLHYLCALSHQGLTLIDKITEKEVIDFIDLNKSKMQAPNTNFIDLLSNLPMKSPTKAMDFLKNTIKDLKNK